MKKLILFIVCLMVVIGAEAQLQGRAYLDSVYNAPDNKRADVAREKENSIIKKHYKDSVLLAGERQQLAIVQHYNDSISKIGSAKNDRINAAYPGKMIKKYGKAAYDNAVAGKIWIGMPDELCVRSLGTPNRSETNYTNRGTSETWIYNGRDYVITFKNHKAIAITTNE